MKKMVIAVVAILVLSSSAAFAQDTKWTISLKGWANSWEEKFEDSAGGEVTFDLGSSLMLGPALSVKFENNWFLSASYLVTTQDYESSDWYDPGDKLIFDRKDLDLTAGYMFTPRFGAFFGYKSIEAGATYELTGSSFDVGTNTWSGPGVGILGNIPLGTTSALYGSLAVMVMDYEYSDPSGGTYNIDMAGASLEVGVAFAFADALSANVGIKAQSFSGEDDFGITQTDTFSGLTFGLNYTF